MRDKEHKTHKDTENMDRVRDMDHNGRHEDDVFCAEDIIKNFPFMSTPDFLI